MLRRSIRRASPVRAVLAAALALAAFSVAAQAPGLISKAAPRAQAPATEAPREDGQAARLRAALAAAQAELERIAASPNQALDAPAGTPVGELLFRQGALRNLVRSYQQQIDEIAALEKLRGPGAPVDQRMARWRLDESRSSFGVLEVEALRRELQSKLRQVDVLTANLVALDSQIEFSRGAAQRTDQQARQLLEQVEKLGGQGGRRLWQRDLQLLRSRAATVAIDAFAVRRQVREEELSQTRADLAFVQAQLAKSEGKVTFPEQDRDALVDEFNTRFKVLDGELAAGLGDAESARKSLAAEQSRLAAARAQAGGNGGAGSPGAPQEQLERWVELAQLRLATANVRINVLRLLIGSVEAQRAIWGTWFDIAQARDGDTERQIATALGGFRDGFGKIHASARSTFDSTLVQVNAIDNEIVTHAGGDDGAFLKAKSAILHERLELQGRLLGELMSAEDLLQRWKSGFVGDAGQTTDRLGADEWKRRTLAFAHAVWSFELFAAEDTIEVEGRKLTTERSITLGKVVTAVLILVIGLWVARVLIDASGRFAVRYLRADESATRLAGKWIFALVFMILFLLSLTTVKIPLTVFAFLGGAVAIGVGFGMQTLLKNLISGLMVLIERPFRLGDVIEVGPVRGKVVEINLRSSLIRNRDEIETLVPNSTFIEQNVTNWTYSSNRVRCTLNVGIAYGSPTTAVRELMLGTAQRHKLVLRSPEPEVFFEDFGADALSFSLQYWLNLAAGVDMRRVASDLRFMLDQAFADAGIVIAFPQRDVHLDVGQAIPVRIVTSAATGA